MNGYCAVLITASGRDEAKELATALIGAGLAPCVNIVGPVLSVYQWKGRLHEDEEVLMIAKTGRDRFEELRELVESKHSYDVPEIVSLELSDISPGYAAYLGDFFTA